MGLASRIRPAATELGLAFSGLLVGWLVASLLLSVGQGLLPEGSARASAGLVAGPTVTALAALFYWQVTLRWTRAPEAPPPPVARASLPRTALWIVGGWGLALGGSIVVGLLLELLVGEVQEQAAVLTIVNDARSGGPVAPAVALCISAVVLAPMAEEWLFRGLLYRRIRATSGPALAYLVSGVAFAAIHNNATGFGVYLWLAVAFALTLQQTGRLWAAMAVHLGNNAFVLAALFLGVE